MKTLDELREEANTEEVDQQETESMQQEELEELEEPEQEDNEEVEAQGHGDAEQGDDNPTDDEQTEEAWQHQEKKFTDNDIAAAKRKLKGRLADTNSENEELKAKNAQLEAKNAQLEEKISTPALTGKPSRDQFYDADDPEDAYIEALTDWKINNKAGEVNQKQQQNEYQRRLNQDVTEHYTRAENLIKGSNISEEVYQSADSKVRAVVNRVTNGNGNTITDNIISVLGDGSEKALFYVGRNQAALDKLESELTADPTGLRAVVYLAKKTAELNSPVKRTTTAKPPAKKAEGDDATNFKSFKKAYDKASKSNDVQSIFNLRRQAKQAGVNVADW